MTELVVRVSGVHPVAVRHVGSLPLHLVVVDVPRRWRLHSSATHCDPVVVRREGRQPMVAAGRCSPTMHAADAIGSSSAQSFSAPVSRFGLDVAGQDDQVVAAETDQVVAAEIDQVVAAEDDQVVAAETDQVVAAEDDQVVAPKLIRLSSPPRKTRSSPPKLTRSSPAEDDQVVAAEKDQVVAAETDQVVASDLQGVVQVSNAAATARLLTSMKSSPPPPSPLALI